MSSGSDSLTLVSWNLLLDPGRAGVAEQISRLDSIVQTLRNLPSRPDLIALFEVEGNSPRDNLALAIAKKLGYIGCFWQQHGRPNEGIAILTDQPQTVNVVELDPHLHQRIALFINLDGLMLAATHWSPQPRRNDWRRTQSLALISALEPFNKAIILGDLNTPPNFKPRRLLEKAGFKHDSARIGKTFPTPSIPYQTIPRHKRPFVSAVGGFSIDAAYSRGVEVISCTRFHGQSDHYGLLVSLKKN